MDIKDIRTRDDFIVFLNENYADQAYDEDDGGTPAQADWFICIVNARMVFDSYNTKDIAAMFLDGVPAVKDDPEKAHDEFWATFFEEVDYNRTDDEYANPEYADEAEKDAVEIIEAQLEYFFG